jgi:hypothetical protein
VSDIKAIAAAVKSALSLTAARRSKWHRAIERNTAASAERADTLDPHLFGHEGRLGGQTQGGSRLWQS